MPCSEAYPKKSQAQQRRAGCPGCQTKPKGILRRVCRESIGPLVDPGGNLVSDEAGMATLLNNHFAFVFTIENTDELPRLDAAQADAADHAGATLDTVQFTPAIVRKSWASLRCTSRSVQTTCILEFWKN